MALYYTLPIYKSSYNLISQIFCATRSFSREYKYTVGEELKKECVFIIRDIYRANKAKEKFLVIEEAREHLEIIRLYVRLMKDCGQFGLKIFVAINLNIEDVSKQLTSWENYERSRGGFPPESSVDSARAQTSERSKSNNPLVSIETRNIVMSGFRRFIKLICATNAVVIFPPVAGNRNHSSGGVNNRGSNGNYWSSRVTGVNAYNLNFNASAVNPANNNNRANGFSVRCVKDLLYV